MAGSKTIKTMKGPSVDAGSSNGNWGSGHAGNQVPGQSTSMGTSSGKFAQGGNNPMFPVGHASPAKPA